jgi:uncharacterized protein (TIGR03437 family)
MPILKRIPGLGRITRQVVERTLQDAVIMAPRLFPLFIVAAIASGQPFSDFFVSNDANYSSQGAVAPGSIFTVSLNAKFGLLHDVEGIAARINVGGRTVDANILSGDLVRFRALLPAETPLGDGVMTVTANGLTSGEARIRILPRRFSLYGVPPGEIYWPRTFASAQIRAADGSVRPLSLKRSARPGETLLLSGTGMGVGAPADLEVIVGNERAKILSAGPSGLQAGVDEVAIEVPQGIEGCFVPLWIRFVDSGDMDQLGVAISSGGGACADLPREVVEVPDAERALNVGLVNLSTRVAVFGRGPYVSTPPGTCRLGGTPAGEIDFSYYDFNRDSVGEALHVETPAGIEDWRWSFWYAGYASADAGMSRLPAIGEYRLDNGVGSQKVGPFQARVQVTPVSFLWTNDDMPTLIGRGDDLAMTWEGGDAAGFAVIFGSLYSTSFQTVFQCVARADQRSFAIPSFLWSATAITRIAVTIGYEPDWRTTRFPAPGLDLAYATWVSDEKPVRPKIIEVR